MAINTTVATTVPGARCLHAHKGTHRPSEGADPNFKAVPIQVTRGELMDGVSAGEQEDDLRGQLLGHLLEEALKDGSESIMGDLRSCCQWLHGRDANKFGDSAHQVLAGVQEAPRTHPSWRRRLLGNVMRLHQFACTADDSGWIHGPVKHFM